MTLTNSESEEVERARKVFIPCRHCGHARISHWMAPCYDGLLKSTGEWLRCFCENYESKDNLEFLERKYNENVKKKGDYV